MNYGYVIKRAWEITWNRKTLLLFGFIGSSGVLVSQLYYLIFSNSLILDQVLNIQSGQIEFDVPNLISYWVGSLLIALIVSVLNIFGMIGIIRGIFLIEKQEAKLQFNDLVKKSLQFFWRILGLTYGIPIILGLIAILLFLVVIPIFGLEYFKNLMFLIFCCLYCVLIIISWVMVFLILISSIALIDKNISIFQAIKIGWGIFRKNLGVFIFVSFTGFILGFLVAIVILVLMVIFVGTLGISPNILSEPQSTQGVSTIIFTLVYWLFGGFFLTYIHSFWTLLYLEIKKKDTIVEELEPETI